MAMAGAGKENQPAAARTRSRSVDYDPEVQCVLCLDMIAQSLNLAQRGSSNKGGVVRIQSLQVKNSLVTQGYKRDDEWGLAVRSRLQCVFEDKMAMKIKYHRNCYKTFYSAKSSSPLMSPPPQLQQPSPVTPSPPPAQRPRLSPSPALTKGPGGRPRTSPVTPVSRVSAAGRKQDLRKAEAFEQLCSHLEANQHQQFSMKDAMGWLKKYDPEEQYSERSVKSKLQERYPTLTAITSPGQSALFTFTGAAQTILRKTYLTQNSDKWKLDEAVRIIRRDIMAIPPTSQHFPSIRDMAEGGKDLIPASLIYLLTEIITYKKTGNYEAKCLALANAIVAATRPISFQSPLQLGVAVHLHRSYGSSDLVTLLHRLGACASYKAAIRYENAVVFSEPPPLQPLAFLQWSFDNVDYNVCSLDGLVSWHCLGGICSITPSSAVGSDPPLLRPSGMQKALDKAKEATIPVKACRYVRNQGLKTVSVADYSRDDLTSLLAVHVHQARCWDHLWLVGTVLTNAPAPNWSGYMEVCTRGLPFQTSAVHPLPFINLLPSDPNALNTSLAFAIKEADRQGQRHCFVTYDQPLFWKAADVLYQSEEKSPLRRVILRLGGFHLLMSFLGCIGYVMAGSGLEVMWETVFAKNSIQHMSSGHHYARAVRAHYLSQIAVTQLLIQSHTDYFKRKGVDFEAIRREYEWRLDSNDRLNENKVIETYLSALDSLPEEEKVGKTEKLWLLYLRLVEYLHYFIRAERAGDWHLHVAAMKLMLPAFPAAGHLNYAKSLPLYLKIAENLRVLLEEDEYAAFVSNFSIRRSEKFFAGLSSDLTIEQVLMAALKGKQGVTRGRGMNDSTIATFVKTMPLCTRVTRAVKSFAGCLDTEVADHIDLRVSRQRRDQLDTEKMYEWLKSHSPFTKPEDQLVSVSSGLSGDCTVNCHELLEVGKKILAGMAGKNFGELTLKRKDRVLPLAAINSSIKINNCVEPVNDTQLFHRIVILNLPDTELATCFDFELAPRPLPLFDENGMRQGKKPSLLRAFDALCPSDDIVPPQPSFVFDGGYLLHHVVWPRPATFGDIAGAYVSYVKSFTRKFQGTATVVFDGYAAGPTTKDAEHARRATRTAADVLVEECTEVITGTQAVFLTNSTNKAGLIKLLTNKFQAEGIQVVQARADADRDVVVTAISEAGWGCNAVIVGDDTDLTVLMLALTPPTDELHIMTSTSAKGTTIRHSKPLQVALKGTAQHLLFLHAMTGCDTTSYPHRRSKKDGLTKLMKRTELKLAAKVFENRLSTAQEVSSAGETFLRHLYAIPKQPNLNRGRYFLYKRAIAKQPVHAKFELKTLPPTSAEAALHSARAFLQVQAWMGYDLPPTEWGWKLSGGDRLQPQLSSQPPAPDKLLKLIVCNCRTCANNNCECRRSGLKCSPMCGQCAGISCANKPADQEVENEDADDPDEAEGGASAAEGLLDDEEEESCDDPESASASATSL